MDTVGKIVVDVHDTMSVTTGVKYYFAVGYSNAVRLSQALPESSAIDISVQRIIDLRAILSHHSTAELDEENSHN